MLISTGIPTKEDLQGVTPPAQRRAKGPVAMAECFQKIPCNPCAASCPVKAIHIGEDINECPTIDFDLCTGCGTCLTKCPGRPGAAALRVSAPAGGRAVRHGPGPGGRGAGLVQGGPGDSGEQPQPDPHHMPGGSQGAVYGGAQYQRGGLSKWMTGTPFSAGART